MANNIDNKKHYIIEALLSAVLIIVTVGGVCISNRMASFMEETNRAELRPYLYIKFLEQAYFKYDGTSGKLLYTLTNNGKVSAFEIIRSYKVYKIKGDAAVISRPTYVNVDFVYALAPQETLEGQPDQIDGISFSEKDISDGSYYLIELYVSYKGTESVKGTTYYSKVEIKIQPPMLYLIHRDEGIDQNLEKFLIWRDSSSPEILSRAKYLSQVYRENVNKKISINTLRKPNMVGAEFSVSSFYYDFLSMFTQLTIAILALFGLLNIFRLEFEDKKLLRTYDNAKAAIPHPGCLDKDVKFYLFKSSCESSESDYGSRDIRIQIHNLENVKSSAKKLLFGPSICFLLLVLIPSFFLPFIAPDGGKEFNIFLSSSLLSMLIILIFWIWIKGNELSMDTRKLTYNVPNPYENFTGKLEGALLHLIENIDLIERDIIEFNSHDFVMNTAFKDIENAINHRKKRLNEIAKLLNAKSINSDYSFIIKASETISEPEKAKIKNIADDENRDRLIIVLYLLEKFKNEAGESLIRNYLNEINTRIIKQMASKGNR